jgi:hypothetical protein
VNDSVKSAPASPEPILLIQTGRLERDCAGFALQADDGTRYRLELSRVPVDHVAKRVRVTGVLTAGDCIVVEGVAAA